MRGEQGIDWPGLLKWSLNYSDGTHETSPMTVERLRFLEAAMKEAMSMYEDPNDVVRESVKKMKEEGVSEEDTLNALHLIERCVDEAPEVSRNLDKLGALEVLIEKINDSNPKVSEAVLQIFSFAFPHNPQIQRKAWGLNCLSMLMDQQRCVESQSRFGALSGLIRHEPEIEKDFIKQGGAEIITAGLSSINPKVQLKAANLLRHLFEENSLPPELALKSNIGSLLARMISMPVEDDEDRGMQYGETVCSAVIATLTKCSSLVETNPQLASDQLAELRKALHCRLHHISSLKAANQNGEELMINQALELIEQGVKQPTAKSDGASSHQPVQLCLPSP